MKDELGGGVPEDLGGPLGAWGNALSFHFSLQGNKRANLPRHLHLGFTLLFNLPCVAAVGLEGGQGNR